MEAAIRDANNIHFPRTRADLPGEHPQPLRRRVPYAGQMARSSRRGRAHTACTVHLDGARIFNAAVALGVPVRERSPRRWTRCSSASPRGWRRRWARSCAGPAEFIHEARRNRKVVGGGMRQAGIIAAAGIVALEQMVDRLAEDHANARRLAEGLAEIPGVGVDLARVQTNIVIFDLLDGAPDAAGFAQALAGARR